MSEPTTDPGPYAVAPPEDATIETLEEGAPDAFLRTDNGVRMHCARSMVPEGAAVGSRVVVETAAYFAPLKRWRAGRVRLEGAQLAAPTEEAEKFWAGVIGPADTPRAVIEVLYGMLHTFLTLHAYGQAGGKTLLSHERETYREIGRARVGEIMHRAGEIAPTLAYLETKGLSRQLWGDMLQERARRVPPEVGSAPAALVAALDRLRQGIARGAYGQASALPPATRYEREQHHERMSTPGPVREVLALTNGIRLFDGAVEMDGIFDSGADTPRRDAGKTAGTIHIRPIHNIFSVSRTLECAPDGRLVTYAEQEAPSGNMELVEVPAGAEARDYLSFFTALATLDRRALRDIFPPEPAPPPPPPEAADLAEIEDLEGPEEDVRALGESRAGAGDPWGHWVLANLAGKAAPSEDELRAIAGDLEPAFRRGRLDDAPGLEVEFYRGFARRIKARSVFDFHVRYLLRRLPTFPWGGRFEHLEVDRINVSHPHRFGDVWEILEETGLPPNFKTLTVGNRVGEHFLPRELPDMEELTLIGDHYELPHGTIAGCARITLEGASRFGDLGELSWPSPELLTLRAPGLHQKEDEDNLIESMEEVLDADFIEDLPVLRLERWSLGDEKRLSKVFAGSEVRRVEMQGCDTSLVRAMKKRLGPRLVE